MRPALAPIAVALGRFFVAGTTLMAYAAGVVLVSVGAYLIAPAAGYIVGGIALAASAVMFELKSQLVR